MSTLLDVLGGLSDDSGYKPPVRVATTTDLGDSLTGLLVIDGIQLVAGDRVLVWNQGDNSSSGIWNAQSGAWSRSIDFTSSSSILFGTQLYVAEGTQYAGRIFVCQTDRPVIGTTDILFQLLPPQGVAPSVIPSRYINAGSADTASTTDGFIGWNSASGAPKAQTVQAASSMASGQNLTIKDVFKDSAANPITITPLGGVGTIDGKPNVVINQPGGSLTLHADPGANNYDLV